MPKKSKLRDVLETIFYGIFSLAIIAGIVIALINLGAWSLLIICPALLLIICLAIGIRRDNKKEKKYHDEHVTEISIEDVFFGNSVFERDDFKNELQCKAFNIPFGKYSPKITICNYNEENNETYFRAFEFAYKMHEQIINKMLAQILEAYSSSKEITPDSLNENFGIENISIKERGEYFLEDTCYFDGDNIDEGEPEELIVEIEGNINHNKLYNACYMLTPSAYIDVKTQKICWTMEE